MDIRVFQAGFDAHRARHQRSDCSYEPESPEYQDWIQGWDTRQSYLATEPLISQIYLDTIGDILRTAYGAASKEPLSVEMIMLLLELGVASEVRKLSDDQAH